MNEWVIHWSKGAGTLESKAELKAPWILIRALGQLASMTAFPCTKICTFNSDFSHFGYVSVWNSELNLCKVSLRPLWKMKHACWRRIWTFHSCPLIGEKPCFKCNHHSSCLNISYYLYHQMALVQNKIGEYVPRCIKDIICIVYYLNWMHFLYMLT